MSWYFIHNWILIHNHMSFSTVWTWIFTGIAPFSILIQSTVFICWLIFIQSVNPLFNNHRWIDHCIQFLRIKNHKYRSKKTGLPTWEWNQVCVSIFPLPKITTSSSIDMNLTWQFRFFCAKCKGRVWSKYTTMKNSLKSSRIYLSLCTKIFVNSSLLRSSRSSIFSTFSWPHVHLFHLEMFRILLSNNYNLNPTTASLVHLADKQTWHHRSLEKHWNLVIE